MSDRIELPPCPDCGCAVNDLHMREELAISLHRYDPKSILTPQRDIELLPCMHKVATYTIQHIKGTTRITEIHMKSGWKWTLGWSQAVEMIQQNQPVGLTPGQTPGYDLPRADDQDQDPDRTGTGGPPGGDPDPGPPGPGAPR